jgi:hypothetical protein
MTVDELIEELKKFEGALTVAIPQSNSIVPDMTLDTEIGVNTAINHPAELAPNRKTWHWESDLPAETIVPGERVVVIF